MAKKLRVNTHGAPQLRSPAKMPRGTKTRRRLIQAEREVSYALCEGSSWKIHTAQESDLGDVPYSGRVLDENVGIFGAWGLLVIKKEVAP